MKTVLIVDDEPSICTLISDMLTECDLRVLTAYDGFEAIRHLRAEKQDVELAVLDYSLPGMDCETLIQELRRTNDRIKLIISSGETRNLFSDPASLGIVAMLPKPYSMHEMMRVVLSQLTETSA